MVLQSNTPTRTPMGAMFKSAQGVLERRAEVQNAVVMFIRNNTYTYVGNETTWTMDVDNFRAYNPANCGIGIVWDQCTAANVLPEGESLPYGILDEVQDPPSAASLQTFFEGLLAMTSDYASRIRVYSYEWSVPPYSTFLTWLVANHGSGLAGYITDTTRPIEQIRAAIGSWVLTQYIPVRYNTSPPT